MLRLDSRGFWRLSEHPHHAGQQAGPPPQGFGAVRLPQVLTTPQHSVWLFATFLQQAFLQQHAVLHGRMSVPTAIRGPAGTSVVPE